MILWGILVGMSLDKIFLQKSALLISTVFEKHFWDINIYDLDSHWKNVLESPGLLLWWFLRTYFLIIQQCCWNDPWKNISFKISDYEWMVLGKIFLKKILKKMSLKIKIYDLKGLLTKYSLKYSFLGLNHP